MRDVNESLCLEPGGVVPLVGFDALPDGFRFQVNMHQFGGMRCFVSIPVACLVECFSVIGVGLCPLLIHEAIYKQVHLKQVSFSWMCGDDLPVLIEVFSKYRCHWEHFDARFLARSEQ